MNNLIEKITDLVCIVFLLEIIFSQKKIISKSQILCLDKNSFFCIIVSGYLSLNISDKIL